MQMNEIYFAGNAGKDAVENTTGTGMKVVNFPLCHTYKVKGHGKEIATWVKVKVFGVWCETARQIKKGDNVFVKGSLNISQYTNKEGKEATAVEISAYALCVTKRLEFNKPMQGDFADIPPPLDVDQFADIPF